jgi:phage gpG-like protein
MNATIDSQDLQNQIMAKIMRVRPRLLTAMRDRFYDITIANFGIMGPDRPRPWDFLTPGYAKKVGRPYATLEVSGRLKASIMKGGVDGESTTVSVSNSSVPYATIHQRGGGNIPARPYFPVDKSGKVMRWTQSEVTAAAQDELRRALGH